MSGTAKRYSSDAVDILYAIKRCIHVAECVHGLPSVFERDRRPWIMAGAAPADDIAEVILRCPSGALHFERKDGGAVEPQPVGNTVTVSANGPLYVRGVLRISTADGELFLEDTRVALCRCGQSQNKPFCDNSHRAAIFEDSGAVEPNIGMLPPGGGELSIRMRLNGPLKLEGPFTIIAQDGVSTHRGTETALCRCGASSNKPFCDSTHKVIGFEA